MNRIFRSTAMLAVPLTAVTLGACDDDDPTGPGEPALTFQTSFEQDRDGFDSDATDLGDPPVQWSVERTSDLAEDGTASMRIRIDNVNDQAKVWMERPLEGLDPNTTYDVEVGFDFATEDWGTVNLWTLFVDVDPDSPTAWTDFEGDAFQTDTGNGAIQDVGYVWETKTAAFTEETDAEGRLHVAIGIWGTFEVLRTYYIDGVEVVVTES